MLLKKIKSSSLKIIQNSSSYKRVEPIPIFIIGMPRSGTTLTEQIITSHPEVFAGGEIPFGVARTKKIIMDESEITKKNIGMLRQKYLEKLKTISSKHRFITDKMPQNFRFVSRF